MRAKALICILEALLFKTKTKIIYLSFQVESLWTFHARFVKTTRQENITEYTHAMGK